MAFFDEISKKVSNVTQSAQKLAEISRLQRLSAQKQSEVSKLFSHIGKLYYDGHQTGSMPVAELSAACEQADTLHAEIDGLTLKLDDLKQIRRCTHCGSIQQSDNRYCSSCGEKLVERVIPAQQETETVMQDAPAQPEPVGEQYTEMYDSDEFNKPSASSKNVYIHWPRTEDQNDEDDSDEQPIQE